MDEVLDPDMLPEDFSEQLTTVARQRKVAELLRKQAEARQAPQGQMVSGRYVRTSPFQQIAKSMGDYRASAAEQALGGREDALARQAGAARQKWSSNFPQALAGHPELQGPPAEGGSPDLAAVAPQPVTTPQIFKKYLAGVGIPGNEKSAEGYLKGALAEQTREDTQAARADEARLTRIKERDLQTERLQARADEERRRADSKTESEAAKREAEARWHALQVQIAANHDAARIEAANVAAGASRERAEATAASKKAAARLPANMAGAWKDNEVAIKNATQTLNLLVDSTGKVRPEAEAAMSMAYKLPFSEEVGQMVGHKGTNIRAAIADIGSMKLHERSGAAVTAAEHPRLKPFVPSPGDKPAVAADKLRNFIRVYNIIQQEIKDFARDQNYNVPGEDDSAGALPAGVTVTPRKK